MDTRKRQLQKEEVQLPLGPQVRERNIIFDAVHNFANLNDTFVHVSDLSGRGTL